MPHHNTDVPDSDLDCRGNVPGYVPDPLFDEQRAVLVPRETICFWVTVQILPECPTGNHPISVTFRTESNALSPMQAVIRTYGVTVEKRRDFQVTQWFYSDALLDWYGLKPFEERYWDILEGYISDQSEHHQDTLYVPIFTPPTDGIKRPTQLLSVRRQGVPIRSISRM